MGDEVTGRDLSLGGTVQNWNDVHTLTILDPACGSGSFLVRAYDYLLKWYLEQYTKGQSINKNIKDGKIYQVGDATYRLSIKTKQEILKRHIYGVDIDRQAVEVTKLSLLLKLMEGESEQTSAGFLRFDQAQLLPDLSENIKCGNSLIGSDFYQEKNLSLFGTEDMHKINAFDWDSPEGFGEIMKRGGFDCVIGNPPYVRQETLGEAFKKYTESTYKTYAGTADLYVYFIEKGLSLIQPKGFYSIIVSNKWMRANYGHALREFLKTKKIYDLIDFGDLPVFQGATTYPCIIKISNSKPTDFKALKVKALGSENDQNWLTQAFKKESYKINLEYLSNGGWSLNTEAEAKLLEKIKSGGIPLEEYVEAKIYRGIVTGLNEAFVIDEETKDKLLKEDPKSTEIIKPFLEGKDIKKYGALKNRKWLIFTRRGINIKKYPSILKYLEQYKDRLKPKPKGWPTGKAWSGRKPGVYQWYEIQDSIDYYREFEKPKLIYPNILKKPEFTMDTEYLYTNQKCFIISVDDKSLLGILNSRFVFWLFKMILPKLRGGFYEPSSIFFGKFPIPQKKNDQLPILVEQILTTQNKLKSAKSEIDKKNYQQRIDILDKQINALVYELYELTPEEIKIVEGEE